MSAIHFESWGLHMIHKTDIPTPKFPRPSRREHVVAQYNSAEAAADYARSYRSSRSAVRFFQSRIWLVQDVLSAYPGGDLLDAGCGPGIMVQTLLSTRPHDFRITALDQSAAMVKYCMANVHDSGEVRPTVGLLEALPYGEASFDITLVMGALEYTNIRKAIREISRVTRPGGIVIVTMLNPMSLYRITEWFFYRPTARVLGAIEKSSGMREGRRHGARATGIRAYPASMLRRLMRQADLQPIDRIYYDLTSALPPFDRLPRFTRNAERVPIEQSVTRGWRRWIGTGYLLVARRS